MNIFKFAVIICVSKLVIVIALPIIRQDEQSAGESPDPNNASVEHHGTSQSETGQTSTAAPTKKSWADWAEETSSSDSDAPPEEVPLLETVKPEVPLMETVKHITPNRPTEPQRIPWGSGSTSKLLFGAPITKMEKVDTTKSFGKPISENTKYNNFGQGSFPTLNQPQKHYSIPVPPKKMTSSPLPILNQPQKHYSTPIPPKKMTSLPLPTLNQPQEHYSTPIPPKKITFVPFMKAHQTLPEQINEQEKEQREEASLSSTPTTKTLSWADVASRDKNATRSSPIASPTTEKPNSEPVVLNVKQMLHPVESRAVGQYSPHKSTQQSSTPTKIPSPVLHKDTAREGFNNAKSKPVEHIDELERMKHIINRSKKLSTSWADWAEMEDSDLNESSENVQFSKTTEPTPPLAQVDNRLEKTIDEFEKMQGSTGAGAISTPASEPSPQGDITKVESLDKLMLDASATTQKSQLETIKHNIEQISPPTAQEGTSSTPTNVSSSVQIEETIKEVLEPKNKTPIKVDELESKQHNIDRPPTKHRKKVSWADEEISNLGFIRPLVESLDAEAHGRQAQEPFSKPVDKPTPLEANTASTTSTRKAYVPPFRRVMKEMSHGAEIIPTGHVGEQEKQKDGVNQLLPATLTGSINSDEQKLEEPSTQIEEIHPEHRGTLEVHEISQSQEFLQVQNVEVPQIEQTPQLEEHEPTETSQTQEIFEHQKIQSPLLETIPQFREIAQGERSHTSHPVESSPVGHQDEQGGEQPKTSNIETTPIINSKYSDMTEVESSDTNSDRLLMDRKSSLETNELNNESVTKPTKENFAERDSVQGGTQDDADRIPTKPIENLSSKDKKETKKFTFNINELLARMPPVKGVEQISHPIEPAGGQTAEYKESQHDVSRVSSSGSQNLLAQVRESESFNSDQTELPIVAPSLETRKGADEKAVEFAEEKSKEPSDISKTRSFRTSGPPIEFKLSDIMSSGLNSSKSLGQLIFPKTANDNIRPTIPSPDFQSHDLISQPPSIRTDNSEIVSSPSKPLEIDRPISESAFSNIEKSDKRIAPSMSPEIEFMKPISESSSPKIERAEQTISSTSSPKIDDTNKISNVPMGFKNDDGKQLSQPISSGANKESQQASTSSKITPMTASFREIVTGIKEESPRLSKTLQKRNKRKTKRQEKKVLQSKTANKQPSRPDEELDSPQTPISPQDDTNDSKSVGEMIRIFEPQDIPSNTLVQLPISKLFLKCPSKEVADDLRSFISEYEELYNESITCSSHVVMIRNMPKNITERELKSKMIDKYKDPPRKIQILSSSNNQIKNALLQVGDSSFNNIKNSPDIRLLQNYHTVIDICSIIYRDEKFPDLKPQPVSRPEEIAQLKGQEFAGTSEIQEIFQSLLQKSLESAEILQAQEVLQPPENQITQSGKMSPTREKHPEYKETPQGQVISKVWEFPPVENFQIPQLQQGSQVATQEIFEHQKIQSSAPEEISQFREISQGERSPMLEEPSRVLEIPQSQAILQSLVAPTPQPQQIPQFGEMVHPQEKIKPEEVPQSPEIFQPENILDTEISETKEASSPKSSKQSSEESQASPEISRTARRRMRQKQKKEEMEEIYANMWKAEFIPLNKDKRNRIDDEETGDVDSDVNKLEQTKSNNDETVDQISETPSDIFAFAIGKHKLLIKSDTNSRDNVPTEPKADDDIIIQLPNTTLFLKCPSKDVADDIESCISEFQALYDESTSSPMHIVMVRNLPKNITERKLKFKLFDIHKDGPRKIQFINSEASQKNIALLQVGDTLLESMRNTPDIHFLKSHYTIDICSIIDRGDELSNAQTEESAISTPDRGKSPEPSKTSRKDKKKQMKIELGKIMNVEKSFFGRRSALNSLSNAAWVQKWNADFASWDSVQQMMNSNEGMFTKEGRLIVLPKISTNDVFAELQSYVLHPHKFGVNHTLVFNSNIALIDCNSEAEARKLCEIVRKSAKLNAQLTRAFIFEVWLHDLPLNLTTDEISKTIRFKYRQNPTQVQFLSYREKPSEQLARVMVSETLLHEMSNSPEIQIRRKGEAFTRNLQIQQCTNCKLLGHRKEMCPLPTLRADFVL